MPEPPPRSAVKYAIYNFTSQFFLIPQGTGIVSIILHQLDYQFNGLLEISIIFWLLTIITFLVGLVLYAARCIMFRHSVAQALRSNLAESCGLASISIAFTEILSMIALVMVPQYGPGWGIAAYVMWWINVIMALFIAVGIPYVYLGFNPPGVNGFLPTAQLPLIAAITIATGGGVLARFAQLDPNTQVPLIFASYILLAIGIPISLATDGVYLSRLLSGARPVGLKVFQTMILCGPWGQSSFALQALGSAIQRGAFANYGTNPSTSIITAEAGQPIGYLSIFMGFLCWGQGSFWWLFALVTIVHSLIQNWKSYTKAGFGIGAWSLIFPWGVYTNAAVQLGVVLPSTTFAVWSETLALMLVIMWLILMAFTILEVFTGRIFGLEKGWIVPPLNDGDDVLHEPEPEKGDGES